MRQAFASNNSELDDHVAAILRMVNKGLQDGDSRQLAVKIVSGQFQSYPMPSRRPGKAPEYTSVVTAWGRSFHAPPGPTCRMKDAACEIEKIWDFMALNTRYVYDTTTMDVFCTLKETLLAGGGDCDDQAVAFATLFGHLGFTVKGRVISLPDDPAAWAHIYPMVGLPKDNPRKWVALDQSVEGTVAGWEYKDRAQVRDYWLVHPGLG